MFLYIFEGSFPSWTKNYQEKYFEAPFVSQGSFWNHESEIFSYFWSYTRHVISWKMGLGAVHKWRLQALTPPYVANNDVCRWYSTGGPPKNDCRWNSLILHSISRYLMSKVAIPIISCSCDEQKLKKLFHLEHSHIRNDDDFDDDAMGH